MRSLKFMLVLTSLLAFADQDLFDKDGRRLGNVTRDRAGGYEVFDSKGNRIGTGKEAPDGSIRVYDPKTYQPLYEIKPRERRQW